jgi:probable phosphoglycerate mutase
VKRLWLVRHGTTDWSRDGRLTGWTDVALNEEGRDQARQLRLDLADRRFSSVVSSDLRRCTETAVLAGFEPRIDTRLRELDFGTLEGAVWDELSPRHQSALHAFDSFIAPGGESVTQFAERVLDFVADLSAGDHLVFTHGGVIRLLLRLESQDHHVAPAGITVLER